MPPQQRGTEEPETNVSVPQQGGQEDATTDKAIEDYNLDGDYKPKWSDPESKAVNEGQENSDTE